MALNSRCTASGLVRHAAPAQRWMQQGRTGGAAEPGGAVHGPGSRHVQRAPGRALLPPQIPQQLLVLTALGQPPLPPFRRWWCSSSGRALEAASAPGTTSATDPGSSRSCAWPPCCRPPPAAWGWGLPSCWSARRGPALGAQWWVSCAPPPVRSSPTGWRGGRGWHGHACREQGRCRAWHGGSRSRRSLVASAAPEGTTCRASLFSGTCAPTPSLGASQSHQRRAPPPPSRRRHTHPS